MAELRAGLAGAMGGRTQIFLLTGEAGIGKTRIATEIAAEAASRGMLAVWGRCCEGAGAPPYWPMTQVVRALTTGFDQERLAAMLGGAAPEIARLAGDSVAAVASSAEGKDDAQQLRFRLFDAFATLLASFARERPLLIVLDDLHDADETSWLMLRFAVREIHDAPVMIVATYREAEVRRSEGLVRVLSDLYRSGRQLPLAGLSEAEVAQVVAGGAGCTPDEKFVSVLHRSTGGNPFFITEVMRSMDLSGESAAGGAGNRVKFAVPESVRASIRGRLSALEAAPRSMLTAAAVLGVQWEGTVLERVTGLAPEAMLRALDRAIGAGILVPDGPGHYRFCHAIIREVIYLDMDLSSRARMHSQIVCVLEDLYQSETAMHLDQIAHHAVAAAYGGSSAKAIKYATAAGEAAFSAFAYERAAYHWQTALMLAEHGPFDPRRLARILERLGDAYSITEFDHPRGIECVERAAKIYESAALPIEAAHLHARLGLMFSLRSPAMNIPRAMGEYRQAELVLRSLPDSKSKVVLYTGLAQAATHALRTQEGLAASHRAMEIATHLGEEALWIRAAAHHSDHLFHSGRLTDAGTLMDDAQHRADRLDDFDGAFDTAWSGGYHPLALWDPREGQRWFARELAQPRMAHALFQRRVLIQEMALGLVFRGQLARAKELLAESPRVVVEAFILLYEGNWERAGTILDESRDAMRAAGSRDGETVYAYFQGLVFLASGDLAAADAMNQVTLRAAIEGPHIPYALNAHAQAALIAVLRDRVEDARGHLARCREIIAGGEDFRGLFGRAALAEAMAAAAEGNRDAADLQFTSALQIFRRYDLPWDMAQTHHMWACALLAAGALSRAAVQFDAAQEIYQRHGAGQAWIDKVNAARGQSKGNRARTGEQAGVSETDPAEGVFRCEGEYWTIAQGGIEMRLRSTKGLLYLGHLLARPGKSVAAEELAQLGSGRARRGSAAAGDFDSTPGHARVMVTKAIKAAIRKIRSLDISVGHNLAISIHTGYSCVYQPDPVHPIRWHVSESPGALN